MGDCACLGVSGAVGVGAATVLQVCMSYGNAFEELGVLNFKFLDYEFTE